MALVGLVELRLDEAGQMGGDVDGDLGFGEIRFDLSGEGIWLEAELLPSDRGQLVGHDHQDVVNGRRPLGAFSFSKNVRFGHR